MESSLMTEQHFLVSTDAFTTCTDRLSDTYQVGFDDEHIS